jgi:hypothetical protein
MYHTYTVQTTLADRHARSLYDERTIYHREEPNWPDGVMEIETDVEAMVQSLERLCVCGTQTRERIRLRATTATQGIVLGWSNVNFEEDSLCPIYDFTVQHLVVP